MLQTAANPQRSAPDSDNRQKADQHAQTSNHQMQPNKRRMQPFRLHCQLLEKAKTTSGCPRLGLRGCGLYVLNHETKIDHDLAETPA